MKSVLTSLGLVVLALCASGVLANWLVSHTGMGSPAVAHPAPPTARAAPTPKQLPLPRALHVPSIGVDAAIEPVGVDATGNMAVPVRPQDVAWYAPGTWPGQPGDAVIAGHLDWYRDPATRTGGSVPSVFARLAQLARGAQLVIVASDGSTQRWTVTDSRAVPYSSRPSGLFGRSGPATLSLVTCAGSWNAMATTYNQRLIVDAVPG